MNKLKNKKKKVLQNIWQLAEEAQIKLITKT
jgi:hypothetical protein